MNAGRPRKPLLQHVVAGTYRRDRHGVLPGNVVPMPRPAEAWTPAPAELRAQGKAGRAFIARMLAAYTFSTVVEGMILLEAGHVSSALQAVRATTRAGRSLKEIASLERIELAWSRQFAALLAQLKVSE